MFASQRAPFSLQTPVEALERLAGCWIIRARANPLSLEVWHFTLRCILPWSWVGNPRPKGCCAVTYWTQSLPDIADEGVHKVKPCSRLNLAQGTVTETKFVSSYLQALRPLDLTMPEYRSNKTAHHPKSEVRFVYV